MNIQNSRLSDLGWVNAGGETERRIRDTLRSCLNLGHYPEESSEGNYGTVHATKCDICGYVYRVDSGD